MVYPVILPYVTVEFEISYGIAGLILSVLWVSYALMSIPGGVFADRFGERLVLVVASAVALFGGVIILISPMFVAFIGGTVVFGIGLGMFGTPGTTVLADFYPSRDTTAIGIAQVAGSLGTIALPAFGGIVATLAGWRVGIGYLLPGFLLLTFGLAVVLPRRSSIEVGVKGESRSGILRRIGSTLASQDVMLIVLALAGLAFVFQGLTGFLPLYLIDMKGFEQWQASILFGILFTGSIAGKLASGPLSERHGRRTMVVAFAAVSTPPMLALPFVEHWLVIVVLVWFGGLMQGAFPVATAYVIHLLPDDIQGSVFGLIRTAFIGLGVIAPPIVGFLADRQQFDAGILILGVVGLFVVFASMLLSPSQE